MDDPATPSSTRDHLLHFGAHSLVVTPPIAGSSTYCYVSICESRCQREFTADEIDLPATVFWITGLEV